MYDLKHTLGRTGLFKQFGKTHRGQRILLGRLENKRVTAGNRHREHPQGNHCREVERCNARTHTQRLNPGVGINRPSYVFNGFTHHHGGYVGRMLNHFNTAPNVAFGVVKGFTGFLGQDFSNFVVVLFQQRLVTQHDAGTVGNRNFFPGFEHFASGINGFAHLSVCGARRTCNYFIGGRVGDINPFVGLALNKFAS